MEGGAFEEKVARLAARRCDDQALPTRPAAAFDVVKILFEDFHRQAEFVTEIVKLPFVFDQPLDDLLTPGLVHSGPVQRFSAFSASHWWIGVSSM